MLKFKTKRDVNGNTYTLVIDTEKKTFCRGYNPFCKGDFVEITKKARNEIIKQLEAYGFCEV